MDVYRTPGYDYRNFRCWIGLLTALALMITVVTDVDVSYLVKYITRFTGRAIFCFTVIDDVCAEENFAGLIGIIFVDEAIDKMIDINRRRPMRLNTQHVLSPRCSGMLWNSSMTNTRNGTISINVSTLGEKAE